MEANRSTAVAAQRVEPPDALDYFPTPPWAVRAFLESLPLDTARHGTFANQSCLEPACGEGHMARVLAEYFGRVDASDIHDYGFGKVRDFLPTPLGGEARPIGHYDWIITNPPFNKAVEFVEEMIAMQPRRGCAVLVRTQWLEGGDRFKRLFKEQRPTWWVQYCERVPMFKGVVSAKGSKATAYGWAVWLEIGKAGHGARTYLHWIEPCRARLERPEDYREIAR
jgi:hypothetical protein